MNASKCLLLIMLVTLGAGFASGDDGIAFFEKEIRPLLVKHCYECHAGEENDGGLRLDSRAGLIQGGDSGPSIDLKNPDASRLLKAVEYKDLDLQMPPRGKLSDREIAALRKWLQMGMPDPREASAAMKASAEPTGMTIEEGRKFWSFLPVAAPAVPAIDDAWIQTPVDAFILKRLREQGLSPAKAADKRTLLRRVTFDLTGLPPTKAEIDAFLNDDSAHAYRTVVDRLLASPSYGIRWGRHWLDVARYSDSNGLDENLAFGNAWRYRDYVVDAFNNDKSYDQFLIEQIAGDLIPGANRESRIATGFLQLGAKVLAEPDREKLTMDTIDEQIDTLGKAFLGMTFGCVRCHDHKFDPIKQTDYYALAAIFKSTRTFATSRTGAIKHWYEHSFDERSSASNASKVPDLQAVDAEIAKRKRAASDFKNKEMARLRSDAQSKAALYLAAATQFDTEASLSDVAAIASPLGLHPRILHHCRLHVAYQTEDAFFLRWHTLVETSEREGRNAFDAVRNHYAETFQRLEIAKAEASKRDPKLKTLEDAQLEAARLALADVSGFLAVPKKPAFAFSEAALSEYHALMEAARIYESTAPDYAAAMGVGEQTVLTSLPIHIRGSHNNLGDPVSREFPEVMRSSSVRPIFPAGQSGRLELARWMASTRHPLTARVHVNRVWGWHFGTALVASTENFGKLGDRPTHPDLLDWLARHFMSSGWSTKELHRQIVLSSSYQQDSRAPSSEQVDPQNRWLSRYSVRRLEAEQIRDAILATSGLMEGSVGGKTVPLRNRQFVFNHTSEDHTKYDSLRRAIYLPVIRNNLYSLFAQFDFPDPTMPTGRRASTTIAPQALLMMNSGLIIEAARSLAANTQQFAGSDAQRVNVLYEMVFGRPAQEFERERALNFVSRIGQENGGSQLSKALAWSLLCQSLFASNEFIFVR